MAVIEQLIRSESDGSISFGDYTRADKSKLDGFKHEGATYKVKTFKEITKLEKDGAFVYESVPGTAVENLKSSENEVSFKVSGPDDSQITLELLPETDYNITLNGKDAGLMKTNLGGKLSFGVELDEGGSVDVKVTKA